MNTRCPHCSQEYFDLPDEYNKQSVNCANCQNDFIAISTDEIPDAPNIAKKHRPVVLKSNQDSYSGYYAPLDFNKSSNVKIHWSIIIYNGVAYVPMGLGLICFYYALKLKGAPLVTCIASGLFLFVISAVLVAFGRLLVNVEKIENYLRPKE